jgi:glycine dehydrogenase
MVRDLTGMEIANASLLDEGTAAAEAMTMLHRVQGRRAADAPTFLVSHACYPQTIAVLESRAEPLGLRIEIVDPAEATFGREHFGLLLQYPDEAGRVADLRGIIERAHAAGLLVAVASDLLALTLLVPPGEMGADVVVGNSQRFGVPLGFGGPHAAFFATREAYVRQVPGRVIGVSVDASGSQAYRMALQTREQHIRREKATSNICTAQALLANMAAMYAVYHGPAGLTAIATRVHALARIVERALGGWATASSTRTTSTRCGSTRAGLVEPRPRRSASGRSRRASTSGIAAAPRSGLPSTRRATAPTCARSCACSPRRQGRRCRRAPRLGPIGAMWRRLAPEYPPELRRTSAFLAHPVFNTYHSEMEMMRYIRALESRDIGLETSMIPLGSCTMKLNAAAEMLPITWPEFSRLHPFVPADQARGYARIIRELEAALCEITGFAAVSLQPNSGAQGELAGLLVIRAWHHARGDHARDVVLIPASAHGTNPASAVMAGLKRRGRRLRAGRQHRRGRSPAQGRGAPRPARGADGHVSLHARRVRRPHPRDLRHRARARRPGVHGRREHERAGGADEPGGDRRRRVPPQPAQDVRDSARRGRAGHGADRRGGAPGAVPARAPARPDGRRAGHRPRRGGAVRQPQHPRHLVRLHLDARRAGADGGHALALLNANYVKARLEAHYPVLYARANGRVAHEMIFDMRGFRRAAGIDEIDIAKRLMDYGFHAPTVSFPVAGTLMIEPTESEPKQELDRFCDAMIAIRGEIEAVMSGTADPKDNVLKHAPHTAAAVTDDEWPHAYSRRQAAYPLPFVRAHKFWPTVGRIDNPYGDRNLFCVCPAMETYEEKAGV